MSRKKPRWMDGLFRNPSRATLVVAVVATYGALLAVILALLRPDDAVLWFLALLAIGSVPLYALASVPTAMVQPYANCADLRCRLTLDEAERRAIDYFGTSGATLGRTPGHGGLPRRRADRTLEVVHDGHPLLVELNWSHGRLMAGVRPVPDPVTDGFDRFMRGLDEALVAPPQRGYPVLASPPAGVDLQHHGSVTVERRHFNYARRIPRLLFWMALLGIITFLCCVAIAAMWTEGPTYEIVPFLTILFVSSLLCLIAVVAISIHLETLLRATMRLEGSKVTYSHPHARPDGLVLDEDALVEVSVPAGAAGRARTPASIAGYTFERGKKSISLRENEGFDHDDLIRIWPDVLAAACRNHTMVGPNLELIVESFHDDARKYKVRESPFTDEGATIELASYE